MEKKCFLNKGVKPWGKLTENSQFSVKENQSTLSISIKNKYPLKRKWEYPKTRNRLFVSPLSICPLLHFRLSNIELDIYIKLHFQISVGGVLMTLFWDDRLYRPDTSASQLLNSNNSANIFVPLNVWQSCSQDHTNRDQDLTKTKVCQDRVKTKARRGT